MSARELGWRCVSAARDITDRYRFKMGRIPHPFITPVSEPPFRVTDLLPGVWRNPESSELEINWRDHLVQAANEIAAHRFSFFNLSQHEMGDPIDWNRDHDSDRSAPMTYSQSIDYRDFRVTGDCKLVWEPNRHHQLVVLARAYRATGDRRYAEAVVEQLDSWLEQNPFGMGMNWRSPLELGVRLINWVWAIDLIRESGMFHGSFRDRLLHSIYLHCWDIVRKLSRGSSANNHLIGEAAGVYIASAYFQELPGADQWRSLCHTVLIREIERQTYTDGCTREQALGYEFFVLQFYLFSGLVGRKIRDEFPSAYWSRIELMLEFLGRLSEGGTPLPLFGDCDDGYVLDLGASQHDAAAYLCIGAILFSREDFRALAGGYCEAAHWLFGEAGHDRFHSLPQDSGKRKLENRAFPQSGYYLLQNGQAGSSDGISILFDCGELGYGAIAAHGHADALSFTLRAFGQEVFVDPGTYDYFTYPDFRNYFRSSRAHNTLVVDGKDQSEMLGPFMWGRRAVARCTGWESRPGGGKVSGEHDGYSHLTDSVIHARTLELDAESRVVNLVDKLRTRDDHEIALYFHLAENCVAQITQPHLVRIEVGKRVIELELDTRLKVDVLRGSEKPIAGWISRGYHHRAPATTVAAYAACRGSTEFVTRIRY